MADIQRTRAQLLDLFADNVTGQISAQDFRDFMVTIMEPEFVNPGDFWAEPRTRDITTDQSARGWIQYSQTVGSDCSFMNVMFLNASNNWQKANVSESTHNGFLGLAMDSYTSGDATAQILMRGIVYNSSFSTVFSGKIGRPVYLESSIDGSISAGITTNSAYIVGWILGSDGGESASGKWYFNPSPWAVKGQ